jgi:hypothetical protein
MSQVSDAKRVVEARAFEAVVWGIPAVNFDLMRQAMAREVGGADNQIVYWSSLPDWKQQTLTPNPDSTYFMPFFDTKDAGPMVLEIPPAGEGTINGSVDDCWQAAIEDVGPAGVDKGEGGRYLILPPDYEGDVPDGYIPMPSETYRGFGLLRSLLAGPGDDALDDAIAYGRRIEFYPLSGAADQPETTFLDASGIVFDATIPYDRRFFESLNRIVQHEPWLTRDKAMIDSLKSIGIEKGKDFDPDPEMQAILDRAAAEANDWVRARLGRLFDASFFEGGHWSLMGDPEVIEGITGNFSARDAYPIDGRAATYSMAFFSPKHVGTGQFYLMAIYDSHGDPLDGGETYKLTVPADAPVRQYWSATVYDRATHTLIRKAPRSSRSSQTAELNVNEDGSVDLFFSPSAPEGNESNWIPTNPSGQFEVLFRLYGPDKSFFEKAWPLGDLERVH